MEIAIDDYKIFSQDRLHKKGGGVCAFVKKVLKVTIINKLTYTSESNFQQLWIKLQNKKMKTIISNQLGLQIRRNRSSMLYYFLLKQ